MMRRPLSILIPSLVISLVIIGCAKPEIKIEEGEQVTVPYKSIKKEDENLQRGTTQTVQKGVEGKKTPIYDVTYVNGKETKREKINERIDVEPQNEIIVIGTGNVGNINEDIKVGEVRWRVLEASKVNSLKRSFQAPLTGTFLIVKLEAEHQGKETGTIDSSQFEVDDAGGRSFEPSSEAQTALMFSGKENLFLKQVHPNIPVTGYVAFQLAPDAQGLKLKIEDLRLLSSDEGLVNLGL